MTEPEPGFHHEDDENAGRLRRRPRQERLVRHVAPWCAHQVTENLAALSNEARPELGDSRPRDEQDLQLREAIELVDAVLAHPAQEQTRRGLPWPAGATIPAGQPTAKPWIATAARTDNALRMIRRRLVDFSQRYHHQRRQRLATWRQLIRSSRAEQELRELLDSQIRRAQLVLANTDPSS